MDATFSNRASLQPLASEIFRLVTHGATADQWAEWLRVPLEHAAADGNLDLFNALIAAGADGSAGYRGCHGRTLFDAAATGGSADVVSALLVTGAQADINVASASSKMSSLYLATARGHGAAAIRLIRAGADVHFWDPADNCSVLYRATCGVYLPPPLIGNHQLIKELLIAGARPRTLDHHQYSVCLSVAADSGLEGIVTAILAGWAHIRVMDERRYAEEVALGKGFALVAAARNGHLPVVDTLLAAGSHPSFRFCDDTLTALDEAASRGHLDVLRLITSARGVDLNTIAGESGCTPLHFAAHADQAAAVELLIDAGAFIEGTGDGVGTPLLNAAVACSSKAMLALLQRGADLGVQTARRLRRTFSPLHAACLRRHGGLEVAVDLLLRWGADETAVDDNGKTPAETLDLRLPGYLPPGESRCSQEEIDRVRTLLARAPADRAWRRRGWLVMLRSRTAMAGSASREESSCETDDGVGVGSSASSAAAGGRRPEGRDHCKVARNERTERVDPKVPGKASTSEGLAETDGEGEGWNRLVASLLGLELEGVFRTVVGFL